MKDQYVGDCNDYYNYGLLRLLTDWGRLSSTVAWMLTPHDDRSDGSKLQYLDQPRRWRHHDPELFDKLHKLVRIDQRRSVRALEATGFLANCRFFGRRLTDDVTARKAYFETLLTLARGTELVYFDPDNGLSVASQPYGRKGSSKYLYDHELAEFYAAGHSLVIYQHFPRRKRAPFVREIAGRLRQLTGATGVTAYITSHVAFFLVPQPRHEAHFERATREIVANWGSRIKPEPRAR